LTKRLLKSFIRHQRKTRCSFQRESGSKKHNLHRNKTKNAEVKTLKRELKKKTIADDTKQELNARLTLLSAMIKEQQLTEKNIIVSFKDSQEAYKQCKRI
jgi:hypothetical protein